jgi:uncharacterized membrane protein
MYTLYNLFLFLHILAVIVWIGGLLTLVFMNLRLARERDPAAMAVLGRATAFFGRAVVGPAAGLTVIAGIVMVADAGVSFGTLWIAYGLGGVAGSILLVWAMVFKPTL